MVLSIVILSILTLVFGYTTVNLLRKNEAHEDVVTEQEELISDIASKIDSSMATLKEIDKLGSFEADDETGDVILFLRPTISKLSQTVADPAVDLALSANSNINGEVKQSLVPVVDVKEMDTILRVKSGDVGVLGGLMEVKSTHNQASLPGAGDMPIIKDIFGSHSDSDEVVELVILLKVTIVNNAEPDSADNRMIKTQITDARPL